MVLYAGLLFFLNKNVQQQAFSVFIIELNETECTNGQL